MLRSTLLKRIKPFLFWSISFIGSSHTFAQEICGEVRPQGVVSGDTILLKEEALLRLALVKAPEIWPDNSPYKSWPHAKTARAFLSQLVDGATLSLLCQHQAHDRFGNTAAIVILPDGTTLQQHIIDAGFAWVFTEQSTSNLINQLYDSEAKARKAKRGVWANNQLIVPANNTSQIKSGWFQIVEGTIVATAKVGKIIYLNFGPDWREDFTIEIPASAEKRFLKAGIKPLDLRGNKVTARGWIDWKSGPRLTVTAPANLNILPN